MSKTKPKVSKRETELISNHIDKNQYITEWYKQTKNIKTSQIYKSYKIILEKNGVFEKYPHNKQLLLDRCVAIAKSKYLIQRLEGDICKIGETYSTTESGIHKPNPMLSQLDKAKKTLLQEQSEFDKLLPKKEHFVIKNTTSKEKELDDFLDNKK